MAQEKSPLDAFPEFTMDRSDELLVRLRFKRAPQPRRLPPAPQGRTVVVHEPSESCPHYRDHAEIQVGHSRVVYHCAGLTVSLPGPTIPGGIRHLLQSPGTLTFTSSAGDVMLAVQRHQWGEEPSRRLIEASLRHGIEVSVARVELACPRATYPVGA